MIYQLRKSLEIPYVNKQLLFQKNFAQYFTKQSHTKNDLGFMMYTW